MEHNENNFAYLRRTSIEKYYCELIKAEHACEYFPIITKVIVRKVLEVFLKDIAEKNNIESNVSAWNLFNNINSSPKFSLPEKIYNYIEIILVNGYEHVSRNNKKISKHPIGILETMHNILCWYLKETEPLTVELIGDLNFRAPSTIEYMEKEICKIQKDILQKDKQINNLRKKIIQLSNKPKIISDVNKTIIEIKREKEILEECHKISIKKIEIQRKQVSDIEKNYKTYIKKLEILKEKCNENQELLFEKESQLVKAEIENQELKHTIKFLDEEENTIETKEHYIEKELKIVRQSYENLSKLTNQYQDILETMEFSYDRDLQKILELQKNNINMKISFEDSIFNENIVIYNKNTIEAKRKISIFKGILDERIKREVRNGYIYKRFIGLKGRELRIAYTIINSANKSNNIISKSKETLLKSNEEKFLTSLSKNLEDLSNISDDEIKLVLYYKLINLSQMHVGVIYNRRQFVQSVENIVERAYQILVDKKDFKGRIRKLDAIGSYYLEKILISLKNKNANIQIHDILVDKIYKIIMKLKQNEENIGKTKIYYDKFDLDNMSETTLKISIKSQVFVFLSIMVSLGNITSFREVAAVILEIDSLISKRPLSDSFYDGERQNLRFPNEYFMILMALSSGITSISQKQQEELLPLLIAEIMSLDVEDNVNFDCYDRMVDLWKHKQQRYNDIFIEKENKENVLESLLKEKQELEINNAELLRTNGVLVERYNMYKDEFKEIVLKSDKRILLPSYISFERLRNKKEMAENNINESKSKLGTLKSMFSPDMWKEQASKLINESNMVEAEKRLIEEAKQKPYFKKEYSVFSELEKQIKESNELVDKSEEKLKDKNSLIDNTKKQISKLQRQLNNIKEHYPDIEEGYY
nr:hypothetical protein [Clostridium chromiireducens]